MSNPISLKKQKLSNKLFAQLTKKQTGQTDSLMAKVLKNMHTDLDSFSPEMRKDGTQTFLKLFNHLMPKETGPLVQVNNNNLRIGGGQGVDMIETLTEFMKIRQKKIDAVEARQVEVSSEPDVNEMSEAIKLPANSPVNPG